MPHLAPLVISAKTGMQSVRARTGHLHEHEVRIVTLDEARDVVIIHPGSVQKVPTQDSDRVRIAHRGQMARAGPGS